MNGQPPAIFISEPLVKDILYMMLRGIYRLIGCAVHIGNRYFPYSVIVSGNKVIGVFTEFYGNDGGLHSHLVSRIIFNFIGLFGNNLPVLNFPA